MLKNYLRKKIQNLYSRSFDDLKVQNGKLFELEVKKNLKNYKDISDVYFKIYSQDYEDGIIQYLLKSLNINSVKFVEIGTQDYSESNTRYIFETMRCEGLIIDPLKDLEHKIGKFLKLWQNQLFVHNNFIQAKNINKILAKYSFQDDLDLFSIDIDGIDYWILKELKRQISKIFILEYNPYFGPNKEICAPNIDKFERFKYHSSGLCWGMSLKAAINIMREKGYTFIGTNRLNCNAFFINNNYINSISINLPKTKNLESFTDVKFRVLKTLKKSIASLEQVQEEIGSLKVFDIKNNKLDYFNNIF